MIVGISGKARAGKNTLCDFIIEAFKIKHNRIFNQAAFADVLKSMCQEHFGLSTEQLWGDDKEKVSGYPRPGKSVLSSRGQDYWTSREIMQELGAFYRKIDVNFWVNKLFKDMDADGVSDFIITDARHVNEAIAVKDRFGVLIRINRGGEVTIIHNMEHESETGLDGFPEDEFDIIVDNNSSLEDLQKVAIGVVEFVIKVEKLHKQGGEYHDRKATEKLKRGNFS